MKKELILQNIHCPNGFNFQNLDKIDEQKLINDLESLEFDCFEYETKYWIYTLKQDSDFNKAVGKWWFKKRYLDDAHEIKVKCIMSGLFEYAKNNKGVVCLYTTEENIQKAAEFINENLPEIANRNISYKYDEATLNGGTSSYKLSDFVKLD